MEFSSLCLLVICFWLHLFSFGLRMVGDLGLGLGSGSLGSVCTRVCFVCLALHSASNVMSLFYILNYLLCSATYFALVPYKLTFSVAVLI